MTFDLIAPSDRRRKTRFDLGCELRYRVLDGRFVMQEEFGKTINISSKGVIFETTAPVPVGKRVELVITWPAKLSEKCGLKMVALCRVVRSSPTQAAVCIVKHQFRTHRIEPAPLQQDTKKVAHALVN